jgi:hypothetical protein
MKHVIGWTILVAVVLICVGISIFSYLQSRQLARELAAAQARSQSAEETVRELRDLVTRLKQEPSHSDQDQSSTNPPAESLASDVPWATSDDGQLQVKFTAERDISRPGQPMVLLCVVKNRHSQAITIDAPMLDPWDIDLSLDGQRVRYHGPVPSPALPQPVPLQPGELATFRSQLTVEHFDRLAYKGMFQVEYTYRSGFENNWKGTIGPLTARWVNQ